MTLIIRLAITTFFIAIISIGCVEIKNPYSKLPPGLWRGVLVLVDDPNSSKNDLELPFNFQLSYSSDDKITITLMNGAERIEVKNVQFGKNKKNGLDTVRIDFPLYDTHISAEYREDVIEGHWFVHYREDYKIPFIAYFGEDHRFDICTSTSNKDIGGRWDVRMEIEMETEYPAVGDFTQNGNVITGTFMTETGDYRFLEGTVCGDQLYLSCFDGSHAYYFDGKILESGNILGRYLSGIHYSSNWTGIKSNSSAMSDPYSFTKAVDISSPVNFSYKNTEGKIVSITDQQYRGKPKIIQLMGTWCPNCLDETNFILEYLTNNPELQTEVIAIAFEKYRDENKAFDQISKFKKRKEIPFEILYGGYYKKEDATRSLGFLQEVKSFPTLVFLDSNNYIRKIHTGFAGPATSEYESFKHEFDILVKELVEN